MNCFSNIKFKKLFIHFFLFLSIPLSVFADKGFSLEKKFINHLGMEFILVEPGTFIMGSPIDEPYRDKNEIQHKVDITRAFYLQTTEVFFQTSRHRLRVLLQIHGAFMICTAMCGSGVLINTRSIKAMVMIH